MFERSSMSFELSVALVELSGSAGRVGEATVAREPLGVLEPPAAVITLKRRLGDARFGPSGLMDFRSPAGRRSFRRT